MRIFITGINGTLGTALTKELRTRGHEVYGCDLQHSPDPSIQRADVTEARQLRRVLDEAICGNRPYLFDGRDLGIHLVVHLAAEFGRVNGDRYAENLWRTNMIGTQNVIEECIDRVIPMAFASSSEAYGASEDYSEGKALREEMLDLVVPRFHNSYSLSKYANERQIFTAVRNDGLKAIVLRFFNVYGPPEKFTPYRSVVCQFAWKLLTNQPLIVNREGYRSHLWIGDWANTVANIANPKKLDMFFDGRLWPGAAGTAGVPVFNVGGTEYESVEDLYHRLRRLIPESTSEVIFKDTEFANSATKRPSNVLAETYLDHEPQMSLDDGLRITVQELRRIRDAQV
jgi:dTDP-glucose 4,6-dehydratase